MDTKQLLIHGSILVAGAGVGFGAGYFVAKKKFARYAEEEIESVREAYFKSANNATAKPDLDKVAELARKRKEQEFNVTVIESEQIMADVISSERYSGGVDETDAEVFRRSNGRVPTTYELIQMGLGVEAEDIRDPTDHDDALLPEGNIFDDPQPNPEDIGDGVEERSARDKTRPYVIEAAEWYTNDTDYDQITLTYWADDDVLADDAERVVMDVDTIVGGTNLHRFGFQSDNPDIVYVRNDRLRADYEISKDERNYAEVVHGIDPDSSSNDTPRRMRSNDE